MVLRLDELRDALYESRRDARSRGHDWDVADAYDVLVKWLRPLLSGQQTRID